MKKKFDAISLFSQYLILYFIVAFFPVTIACGALFFSYQALHEEVIRSNHASVTLIQQSLDTKILELESMLYQIDEDPTLTRYALHNAPRSAISTLNKYTLHHDSLSNVMIYVHDSQCFYSADSKFAISDLKYQNFMKDLISHNYSIEEWLDVLKTTSSPTYWPVNNINNMPTYIYLFSPVYTSFQYINQNPSRTVVLLIKQEYIQKLFQSSQTNMCENILLFNSQMELLSQLAPQITEEKIQEICNFLKDKTITEQSSYFELNSENIMLFVSKSQDTGLYYVRFLSKETALQPLYAIRTYTIIILLMVVVIGGVLISFGIRKSYLPIRTLADWIKSIHPQNAETKNELVLFRQAFNDSFERSAALRQALDNSKYGLIDHLLTALIQGNFSTEDAFQNACKNLGIHLDKKYFSVCTVLIEEMEDKQNTSLNFESILKTVHRNLPDELQIQIKDLLFAKKLILVLSSDIDDMLFYRSTMHTIKNYLLEQEGLLTSFGLGSFYDSYDQVGKSYLESSNALDYRIIYGKNCLITPDTYNSNLDKISYPTEDLEALYLALMAQSKDKITDIIQKLIEYTKSTRCSLHIAKYICYDAFSILKKMPAFTNIGYTNTLSQTLNITQLTNFDTIDEFFVSFMSVVQNTVVNAANEPTKTIDSKNDIGPQLVDYICQHCFSYTFQINNMASHFSITPQYMRKLFKNHTGLTISEYVTNMKLEKAMQLLRDSDKNLQEIVIEIGNTDVSGFIRLFKQKTGMTPGQYRKALEK